MPLPQKKFREIVFQILYSKDLADSSDDEIINLLAKELLVSKKSLREALEKVYLILSKLPEVDELIGKTSSAYRFERIQSVEKNILRLGVFEILFGDAIPAKVAIAEAMRLSKKFGTPESVLFVNALLDAIYKSSQGEKVDIKIVEETSLLLKEQEEKTADAFNDENILKDQEQKGK